MTTINAQKLLSATLDLVLVAVMTSPVFAGQATINEYVFVWTDPETNDQIEVTERVFLGCSDGHQSEYTFAYYVRNIDFSGDLNGLSG